MPHFNADTLRKGFSLLELLIVILLISVVYFLGFDGLEMGNKKPKALTPLNLKSNIISSEQFTGKGTLLCVNECRSCYMRGELSSEFEAYDNAIDLTKIQAYTIDTYEAVDLIEYGRFGDEKICLVMEFFQNASSTQLILKDDKGVYFLPAFFGEPQRFTSLEEAKEHWLKNSTLASDNGEFY